MYLVNCGYYKKLVRLKTKKADRCCDTPETFKIHKMLRTVCINDLLVDDGYLADHEIFEGLVNEDKTYEEYAYYEKHTMIFGTRYKHITVFNNDKNQRKLFYETYKNKYTERYN